MTLTVILCVASFLFGYICHVAITKYLKASEAKAKAEADSVIKSAETEIKKL